MDCNEFKNKVVDLFDTNVDAVTRKECFARSANNIMKSLRRHLTR